MAFISRVAAIHLRALRECFVCDVWHAISVCGPGNPTGTELKSDPRARSRERYGQEFLILPDADVDYVRLVSILGEAR